MSRTQKHKEKIAKL